MNGAVAFDTLEFVETLQASGFNEEQARGMAGALKKAQDTHLEALATKHDIELVRHDIELVRRDMKELEARMVIKLGGLMVVAVGAMAALIKLFP